MYKLMIVDDDKLVRERIRQTLPLEALELQLCGEAEDGMQALDLFERHRPQIAIIDINIPFLNGIEVAKRMLAEDADVNVVIITAYGTVDFAREAVRGGVVDFLLKPIDFGELEGVLRRITGKLRESSRLALEQRRMERLLEQGMPLLRSKYFLSLMQTPADNLTEEDCRQYLSDFGINEIPSEICVAIIAPNYGDIPVDEQMSRQAVLEDELKKQLEAADIGCIVVYDSLQRAILVAYGREKLLTFTLEQKISVARDKMRYLHHMDLRASIGSSVPGFHLLQESYRNAEHALIYWTILGNNNIVSSDNVKFIDLPAPQLPSLRHGEIMDLVVTANPQTLQERLTAHLNELVYSCRLSVHSLQLRAVELLALLLSCARDLGEDVDDILEKNPLFYSSILSAGSAQEVIRALLLAAEKVTGSIHGQREEHTNRALGGAKRYIQQHFADPELSLTRVAEHVNLSPSYVSQLFKRMENCTFSEYLNLVRIEQAKVLLSTTHLRVYEVADAVGYQNSKYFFQLFKQVTGKRPREFYAGSSAEETN